MSWLADDPEMLNFVIDVVDSWDESTDTTFSCTSSSDEHSQASSAKEPTQPSRQLLPRKPRRGANRRNEILELRVRVAAMEKDLELLQSRGDSQLEIGLARWEQRARHELSARRQAELLNSCLRATLSRHAKITARVIRMLNQIKRIPDEPAMRGVRLHDGLANRSAHLTTAIHVQSSTDAADPAHPFV